MATYKVKNGLFFDVGGKRYTKGMTITTDRDLMKAFPEKFLLVSDEPPTRVEQPPAPPAATPPEKPAEAEGLGLPPTPAPAPKPPTPTVPKPVVKSTLPNKGK